MIAIVASSDLPVTQAINETLESLVSAAKRDGEGIYVRVSNDGHFASPVEHVAYVHAYRAGVPFYFAQPGEGGREQVYHRDYRLVESCRRVIAFFSAHSAMEGGTGHVVHAAIVKGVPVMAYEIGDNYVRYIGDLDNPADDNKDAWLL